MEPTALRDAIVKVLFYSILVLPGLGAIAAGIGVRTFYWGRGPGSYGKRPMPTWLGRTISIAVGLWFLFAAWTISHQK